MIDVLYEDDALIFVNKPPGLIVQRAYDENEPTLYDIVADDLATRQPGNAATLFLMQRLDRGTSGVMFFSKRTDINANLTRQFEGKRIRKTYVALCEGELAQRQMIDAPMRRVGPISFAVREGGKRAVTHIEPRIATPDGSLLSIRLETGRTHQIRVHLAAIGHALVGDWLYGLRNASRPMLHSAELDMVHPLTNTPLRVTAPPPDDFLDAARERGIVIDRGQSDIARVQLNY